MSVTIYYEEIKDLSLSKVGEKIGNIQKKNLSEIKLYDLLFLSAETSKQNRQGVYIFFDEQGKPVYVGKNSSYHFAQRIATHLSLSKNFWGNDFLRYYIKNQKKKEITSSNNLEVFSEAARDVGAYKLLIIPTSYGNIEWLKKDQILAFEKLFRVFLEPIFNKYNHKEEFRRCQKSIEENKYHYSLHQFLTYSVSW